LACRTEKWFDVSDDTVAPDHDDTAQAPEPDEPETSAVDCGTAAAPELAWSQGDPDEPAPQRHSWPVTWGHVGIIAACSAVLAFAIGVSFWAATTPDKPNAPQFTGPAITTPPAPAPSTTLAAPPPVTITVTPTPTTTITTAHASDAANDQVFLQRLATDGFNNNSPQMAGYAHIVCNDLRLGESETQVMQWLSAGPFIGMGRDWLALFVNDAKVSYPNCAPSP
jgi:hypothetical protein